MSRPMGEIPPPKEKIVLEETPLQGRIISVEARRIIHEGHTVEKDVAVIVHYNPIRFPKSNKRIAFRGNRRETIKSLVEMIGDIMEDNDADLLKDLQQSGVL